MRFMFWAAAILAVMNLESTTQVNAVSLKEGEEWKNIAQNAKDKCRVKQAMKENIEDQVEEIKDLTMKGQVKQFNKTSGTEVMKAAK